MFVGNVRTGSVAGGEQRVARYFAGGAAIDAAAKGMWETMGKPRVTATDRLANVIEVVELGQRTGMLLVERGFNSVLEEGAIYFLSGRVIYAELASLRGREALTALSRWGACRFAFDREAARPAPNISVSNPSPWSDPRASRPSPFPSNGSSQPDPFGNSSPALGERSGIWQSPSRVFNTPSSGFPATQGANSYEWQSGPTSTYPLPPNQSERATSGTYPIHSGSLRPEAETYGNRQLPPPSPYTRQPNATTPLNSSQTAALMLQRRPRRAPDVRDLMAVVTTHNLSRSHRAILLLADGEHNVFDLARLSSKPVEEVAALLGELEARGLIYYYS